MFELKYKITAGDMKAVNKKILIFYFALYLAVSVIGIAIGIVAVVLRPQTLMLVLGIILLALGAVLFACSLMLLIAPKNFVACAVEPSDEDIDVKIDDMAITVNNDVNIPLEQVSKVKAQDGMLVLTVGKNLVFIVKDAIISGQTFEALTKTLSEAHGYVPVATNNAVMDKPETDGENNAATADTVGDAKENDNGEQEKSTRVEE